jgi:hypothetical protein
MRFNNYLEDEHRELRIQIRSLEQRNSMLNGFDVEHHLVMNGDAAAWSSGPVIWFNASKLPSPETPEDVMIIMGVNEHERAHTLFTPSKREMEDILRVGFGSTRHPFLEKMDVDEEFRYAWNILEDQRIEQLHLRRYRRMRPYFVSMFFNVLMKDADDDTFASMYPLARGRRYLSKRYRRMLRRRFGKQDKLHDISRIIDAYCVLNMFRKEHIDRATPLIEELADILRDPDMQKMKDSAHKCETMMIRSGEKGQSSQATAATIYKRSSPVPTKRADADKDVDKEAQERDKDAEDAPTDATPQDATDDATDGDPQPGKGDGDSSPQEAAQQPEPGDGGSTQGLPGDTPDFGGVEDVKAEQDAQKRMVLVAVETRDEVSAMERMIKSVSAISSNATWHSEWGGHTNDLLPQYARRISKEFQRIEMDVDPSWDRRQSSGKLNVGRVVTGQATPEDAFDRWSEGGQGGTEQEWAVLLDMSSSMRSQSLHLSEAAWTLKRAADLMGARMTVFGYGALKDYRVIYGPDERAKTNSFPHLNAASPNTEPSIALLEAQAVLMNSRRPNRGLIIMSDGSWADNRTGVPAANYTGEQLIHQMRKAGILTSMVFLGADYGHDAHQCEYYDNITSCDELPQVMKTMATKMIRTTARRGQ